LNIAKSTVYAASVAILLTAWLAGGCKEAVAPIQPVRAHHHGEQEDIDEPRRKPPSPETPPGPQRPGSEMEGALPNLAEALELARSSDREKAASGIAKLGRLFREGTAQQRAAARQALEEIFLHGSSESRRGRAAWSLGRRFEETYPLFLRVLGREEPNIVVRIIKILQEHPERPTVVRSVRKLLDHPNPKVRAAAAGAIVKMYAATGDVAGLANLLGVYENDLSAKAAIELTVMGRKTVPDLIRVLKTSPEAGQRHGAAMVLAMMCAGASAKQEEFAELALARRHGLSAEARPPDLRAVGPLSDALLHDESAKVREISAQGLGYLGDAQAAPALAKALTEDPSEPVRRRAAAALITVPGRAAQSALEQAVRTDESEYVRRYAAEALGWIGSPEVVPALINATEDEAPEVRRYAAVEIGRLADEAKLSEQLHHQALLALVKLFDDESSDVRWAAVRSVGKLRDKAAVELLAKALDDPAPMVSHAAERGLQKMGIAQRKAEEFERY